MDMGQRSRQRFLGHPADYQCDRTLRLQPSRREFGEAWLLLLTGKIGVADAPAVCILPA
jgi:hypothetical protein